MVRKKQEQIDYTDSHQSFQQQYNDPLNFPELAQSDYASTPTMPTQPPSQPYQPYQPYQPMPGPPQSQYTPYSPFPQYQYPPQPPRKSSALLVIIVIIVAFMFLIIIAGILYIWTSSIGMEDGDVITPSISANIVDRTSYYKIDIVSVSGGSVRISMLRFQLFNNDGIAQFTRTTNDINPLAPLEAGEASVYPMSSSSDPVYENSTTGDGGTVDDASVDHPQYWEGCYMAYIDADSNDNINSGDSIWIFKDWNDNNRNDVSPGFMFKIVNRFNEPILIKEF
jgi:hypothetical protein